MEKKDKIILNNRPQVENLNRANQAWGLRTEKALNGYCIFLAVVCTIVAILFFVGGAWYWGLIFLFVTALLGLSVYFSKRAEEKEKLRKEKKEPSHEAIFKDHEE